MFYEIFALIFWVIVSCRIIYLLVFRKNFFLYLRDILGIILFIVFLPYIIFLFSPAYADTLDVYVSLSTSVPEIVRFNGLLLNSLAMAIPTALGGGALILIGRDFYVATQKSITESLLTAKMAGFMFSRGLSALGNRFPILDDGGGGGGSVVSEPKLSQFLSKDYVNYVNSLDDFSKNLAIKQLEGTFKYYGTPEDLQKFYNTYSSSFLRHSSNDYFI